MRHPRMALLQMRVVTGQPYENMREIMRLYDDAVAAGADIVGSPEGSVQCYLIGDMYEDEGFLRDIELCNEMLREYTRGKGAALVWGSVVVEWDKKGQDGRVRKHNAAIVAQDGEYVSNGVRHFVSKTLHPNYRIFDDTRHFYSPRFEAEEYAEAHPEIQDAGNAYLRGLLQPFPIAIKGWDRPYKLGVMLCEDGWPKDYFFSPSMTLVENGAEGILDLSDSNWSWQKNRKRHETFLDQFGEIHSRFPDRKVCGGYVNPVGLQNNGRNFIPFDGGTCVYRPDGRILAEAKPYETGILIVDLDPAAPAIEPRTEDDTRSLAAAFDCQMREYRLMLPERWRNAVVAISGGIDSTLMLYGTKRHYGADHTYALHLPGPYTTPESTAFAQQIADNCGVRMVTISITEECDSLATKLGIERGTPEYENIQARQRLQVIASFAQLKGAIYFCHTNKVEGAFGYGTKYADIAGSFSPLADMVKREIRQLAHFFNEEEGWEVIPNRIINRIPTAELDVDQKDPFDYGDLHERGYHDELVRAFIDFRMNADEILERYVKGTLEELMRLTPGRLAKLFPTAADFLRILRRDWNLFHDAIRKQVEMPPVALMSKRSLGYDFRRAIMNAYFTHRFLELERQLLDSMPKAVAVYGGSYNPSGIHHREIAETLATRFPHLVLVPCGDREDKRSVAETAPVHRLRMVELAFAGIPRMRIDPSDILNDRYTPTYLLDRRIQQQYPTATIWHVVGEDLLAGGSKGQSEIQRSWQHGPEIWEQLHFAILERPGSGCDPADLPPKSIRVPLPPITGSSTEIRRRLAAGEDVGDFLAASVEDYIREHGLYGAAPAEA